MEIKVQREYNVQNFVDSFGTIYFLSFPKAECVDLPTLITTINEGSRWLFTARVDSQLVGFCTTIPLHGTDMHFGEYMAIDPAHRSYGIGSELFGYMMAYFKAHTEKAGFIFEMESPRSGPPKLRRIRERRLKFFLNAGARPVPGADRYRGPDLSGDGFVDMILMWVPFYHATEVPATPTLLDYVKAIYQQSYHLPLYDSRLKSVLSDITIARKHGKTHAQALYFAGATA